MKYLVQPGMELLRPASELALARCEKHPKHFTAACNTIPRVLSSVYYRVTYNGMYCAASGLVRCVPNQANAAKEGGISSHWRVASVATDNGATTLGLVRWQFGVDVTILCCQQDLALETPNGHIHST